jgi:antitoxin component YwqK of YwqJK toxin-antitoxin module
MQGTKERIGKWTYYHKNGTLNWKGGFSDDRYQGEWIGYHENGKIYRSEIWDFGKLMSVISCYDGQGNELELGTLINGNGTVHNYDIDGNLSSVKTYKSGDEQN